MPLVACPECGTHTRVGSENLGRSIECSKCRERYPAVVNAPSWERYLDKKHPAGQYCGQGLLLIAAGCAVAVALAVQRNHTDLNGTLFGRGSLGWARIVFWAGTASLLIGALLIRRYRRAISRWPRR